MKTLFLLLSCFLLLVAGFSQPPTIINISTGLTSIGGIDPDWHQGNVASATFPISHSLTFPVTQNAFVINMGGTNPNKGTYQWESTPVAISNAQWIHYNITMGHNGIENTDYYFERKINVPLGIKTMVFNFTVAYDDLLRSLELVKPDGTTIPLTVNPPAPHPFVFSKLINYTVDCPVQGDWYVRAKMQFWDQIAGLLVSGNVALNYGICPSPCNCKKYTQLNISGPVNIHCYDNANFSFPKDICLSQYSWTVSPVLPASQIVGQGTNTLTLLPPYSQSNYTITLHYDCGSQSYIKTTALNISQTGCCNCSKLPQQFAINGPNCYCKTKNCNDKLTYTAPNLGSCYKYTWSVQSNVPFNGQGTNQINFDCQNLNAPATYNITCTISCNGKNVTSNTHLEVDAKPDPLFNLVPQISTIPGTISCTPIVPLPSGSNCVDVWYLVNDNNNDGLWSTGEIYTQQIAPTALFTGIVYNQSYLVYHFRICPSCSYNCFGSGFIQAYKAYTPDKVIVKGSGTKPVEKKSSMLIDDINQMPQEFRKNLPMEILQKLDSEKMKDQQKN